MTTTSALRASSDAVLTGALDVARAAAEAIAAPGHVGDHLGVDEEAERVATHRFACLDPAYTGWHWAVTVARVPRGRSVTVDEAVLLPGDGAILARDWVPWSERLAPGDLGVGDLMPTEADDDRLEPGWAAVGVLDPADVRTEDDDSDRLAIWELGLGRTRVLSPIGRADAYDRWYSGEHGPTAPIAEAAPAQCSTCGFLMPLAGNARRTFGVCANVYSPSDGSVVSVDHGCGAHSEVAQLPSPVEVTAPFVDDLGYELVILDDATDSAADDEADGPAAIATDVAADDPADSTHDPLDDDVLLDLADAGDPGPS